MSVYVDSEKCKGCAICVPVCPVQAISILDNKAVIDPERCNDCLKCMDECPLNAICQVFEKEVHLTKSEQPFPNSSKQIYLPARESFSSRRWSQQEGKREPLSINRLIRAVDRFFELVPSSREGRKGKHRRQRGRHKRGRF